METMILLHRRAINTKCMLGAAITELTIKYELICCEVQIKMSQQRILHSREWQKQIDGKTKEFGCKRSKTAVLQQRHIGLVHRCRDVDLSINTPFTFVVFTLLDYSKFKY